MCLWLYHNTINVDNDEDLLPFRQAKAPRKKGVRGVFFLLHHNTINIRKPAPTSEGPVDTWMDRTEQKTGHVVNAELGEKEQLRLMFEPANPEASLEEKLKKKKQRLEKAKVNFQKSMDKLNDELVLFKNEV
jgi:hypothetical protein